MIHEKVLLLRSSSRCRFAVKSRFKGEKNKKISTAMPRGVIIDRESGIVGYVDATLPTPTLPEWTRHTWLGLVCNHWEPGTSRGKYEVVGLVSPSEKFLCLLSSAFIYFEIIKTKIKQRNIINAESRCFRATMARRKRRFRYSRLRSWLPTCPRVSKSKVLLFRKIELPDGE